MRGWWTISVGALLAALAIACERDAQLKAEAGRIGHAVDELRRAPNEAKAPLLEQLRVQSCSAPETCSVQSACVAAYELHARALETIEQSKRLVGGADGGSDVGLMVLQARDMLDRAQPLTKKCADAQGELSRRLGR